MIQEGSSKALSKNASPSTRFYHEATPRISHLTLIKETSNRGRAYQIIFWVPPSLDTFSSCPTYYNTKIYDIITSTPRIHTGTYNLIADLGSSASANYTMVVDTNLPVSKWGW